MENNSSSTTAQTAIHGGYETKDRINYLFWQCGKARLARDGHALHSYLSQLYLETVTLMRNVNMDKVKELLDTATEQYNKMQNDNNQLRKNFAMTPGLYNSLFKLELKLREMTAPHVMPSRNDPGVAINEF